MMFIRPYAILGGALLLGAAALCGGAAAPGHQRAWDLGHLGQNGLEKCRAFNQVVKDTEALQKANGGTLTPLQTRRLEAELRRARQMPPASLTPEKCGVPLGN